MIKTQIVEKILTKNLFTVTVVQTELEKNFQYIIQALKSHENFLNALQVSQNQMEKKLMLKNKNENKVQEGNNKFEVNKKSDDSWKIEFEKINNEIKIVNQRLQKLQIIQNNGEKQGNVNPESQKQAKDYHEKLQLLEKRITITEEQLKQLKEAKSNLKEVNNLSTEALERKLKQESDKRQKQIEEVKKQMSSKMIKLNEEVHKIDVHCDEEDKRLQNLIKNIKNEFDRSIEDLHKLLKDLSQKYFKLLDKVEDETNIKKKMSQQIWKLNDQMFKLQSQKLQKQFSPNQISRLEKIIKQLTDKINHHLKDHPNQYFSQNSNQNSNQNSHQNSHQNFNQNSNIQKDYNKKMKDQGELQFEQFRYDKDKDDHNQFKKDIAEKIKQQKSDFQKALKKIDHLLSKKDEQKTKIQNLQNRTLVIEHLIEGKADFDAIKKLIGYLENKIGYVYRIINVQSGEQDALVARKHWICLSCDKKLDQYKGKVGHHLHTGQLKGKTIQSEIAGGGMLFRNKSKYDLPQVKKF